MKILLVDDSVDTGHLVGLSLRPYEIIQAFSLAEAEKILENDDFKVILIDVLLPDGNGFDFCHRLTIDVRFQNIPKIVLTGIDQTSELVYGFSCGADDYLKKPFEPLELKARVDRYFREKPEEVFTKGEFLFDINFQKCFVLHSDLKIDLQLTPTEFRIFLILAKSEGRAFSREELEKLIWRSNQTFIKVRGIDTHIAHLRQKLGSRKHFIVSIYGKGYAFDGTQNVLLKVGGT